MNDMPWITRNPAKGNLISIKSKKTHEPKALTDAQFEQALAVIPKLNGRTTAEIRAKLRTLFLLMKSTGLAIRDALTTVERSDFRRVDESFYTLRIKRAKTDNVVFCTLEAPLVEEILTARQAAERLQMSVQWVTRSFQNEPGVLILGNPASRNKRKYRTIRIPIGVFNRLIHRATK
jgi:hypothetical protein